MQLLIELIIIKNQKSKPLQIVNNKIIIRKVHIKNASQE